MLGTAKFKNLAEFESWFANLDMSEGETMCESCLDGIQDRDIRNLVKDMLYPVFWVNQDISQTSWHNKKQDLIVKARKMAQYCEAYGQTFFVQQYYDGKFAILHTGNPDKCIIIPLPERFLEFTPNKDYSGITPAALRAQLNASGDVAAIVPADADGALTQREIQSDLDAKIDELNELEQEIKDVRDANVGELAELKRQMEDLRSQLDKKQQEMMAELETRKAEMERVKEQMEGQIYLLSSQIYAIQCYAGEVVKFTKIREGKNAPDTEPIVIHQKLRFLDEDLGRLASLYEIQWEELDLFEEFLKHSPAAMDTFAPNERCVMLVRLSRTGKQQGRDDSLPYSNLLKDYEYFHGRTVGIIIRNGENLYLGWTDESKVHISDDLIISQVIKDTSAAPEFRSEIEKERWEKEQKAEKMKVLDGLISRSFIYNILQGVVDNSSILPLPEGIKLNKQSEYVIYSIADKWLADTRFGSFNDIVETCNSKVAKGDMILSVQHLVPEFRHGRTYYNTWDNPRGRGERNRTHDCHISDCTIYPINLIEFDEPVTMLRYEYNHGCVSTISKKHSDALIDCKILEEFEEHPRHIYVSVEKSESGYWGKTPARANFEIRKHEFINLTYMNSVWLEWVITNKSLGGWTIQHHPVDYAYAIRYLKTASDFIRKREANEKKLLDSIDPSICQDSDWPLNLSNWKLKFGVRNLTKYQAKRFAAYLNKIDTNLLIQQAD
mgnify:CR=1 FL=1